MNIHCKGERAYISDGKFYDVLIIPVSEIADISLYLKDSPLIQGDASIIDEIEYELGKAAEDADVLKVTAPGSPISFSKYIYFIAADAQIPLILQRHSTKRAAFHCSSLSDVHNVAMILNDYKMMSHFLQRARCKDEDYFCATIFTNDVNRAQACVKDASIVKREMHIPFMIAEDELLCFIHKDCKHFSNKPPAPAAIPFTSYYHMYSENNYSKVYIYELEKEPDGAMFITIPFIPLWEYLCASASEKGKKDVALFIDMSKVTLSELSQKSPASSFCRYGASLISWVGFKSSIEPLLKKMMPS